MSVIDMGPGLSCRTGASMTSSVTTRTMTATLRTASGGPDDLAASTVVMLVPECINYVPVTLIKFL